MAAVVAAEPRAELDYAAAVDPRTLAVPPRLGAETRLIIAARVGPTRLIDNCAVAAGEGVVSGTGASDGDGTRRSPT
jgi:pantothenate synthetase